MRELSRPRAPRGFRRLVALVVVGWALVLPACGQSPVCADFIVCAGHYGDVFGVDPPDTSAYAATGECWRDPFVAQACEEQCEDTRAAYRQTLEEAGQHIGPCDDALSTDGGS